MQIDVITLFPELVDAVGRHGMVRQAIALGELELTSRQLRDGASDRRRTVDDRSYGGGPGMVLRPEPMRAVLEHVLDYIGAVNSSSDGDVLAHLAEDERQMLYRIKRC